MWLWGGVELAPPPCWSWLYRAVPTFTKAHRVYWNRSTAWERDIRHDRDLCDQNVSRWGLGGLPMWLWGGVELAPPPCWSWLYRAVPTFTKAKSLHGNATSVTTAICVSRTFPGGVLEGFFGKIFDLWEAKLFALVNVGTAR
jgi:hypothetical protein